MQNRWFSYHIVYIIRKWGKINLQFSVFGKERVSNSVKHIRSLSCRQVEENSRGKKDNVEGG
jgi:hypothetical protein